MMKISGVKINATNIYGGVSFNEGSQVRGQSGDIINVSTLPILATELSSLHAELLRRVKNPEHYIVIGAIYNGELAAKSGSPSKVKDALAALGAGAKWAFDTARQIGVQVAADAIKPYLGLPPS